MESNREVFQEMREQEAFNNPQDYERPEERKPDLFDWCNDSSHKDKMMKEWENDPIRFGLNQRVKAYVGAIKRNSAKYLSVYQIENYKKTDLSGVDLDAKFIGPKMLTDFQKLHFIPEPSQETRDKNLKDLEDGFKKLRKKS